MLYKLFDIDSRIRIEHKKVLASPLLNKNLITFVDQYLVEFSKFYHLTPEDILERYNAFVMRYAAHVKEFIRTGKYPYQLEGGQHLSRIDYDITLILSPVVTIHRHQIINNLIKYCSKVQGKVLVIGMGSGIELEIITQAKKELDVEAYDIHISQFVKDRFRELKVHEQEYTETQTRYDHILAIEILEHLSDPLAFSLMCGNSLKSKGHFVATTAMNVPHFDHLYNFTDENQFENQLRSSKLMIKNKEVIKNEHLSQAIDAKNTWYVFEKIQ